MPPPSLLHSSYVDAGSGGGLGSSLSSSLSNLAPMSRQYHSTLFSSLPTDSLLTNALQSMNSMQDLTGHPLLEDMAHSSMPYSTGGSGLSSAAVGVISQL